MFCDDAIMPLICPTCQTFSGRKQITENATKQLRQIETVASDRATQNEKPAADFRAPAI
jgi:hypothetical protein